MQKIFTSLLFLLVACSFQVASAQDLTITGATSPYSACGLPSTLPVIVTVANISTDGAYGGFSLSYDYTHNGVAFTGGADYNSDDVVIGQPVTHTFMDPLFTSQPGIYVVTVTIVPFVGETNLTNNTFTFTFINYGAPILVDGTTPYFEDFEGPNTWTAGGANSTWALGTPANPIINSAYSGINSWITGLTANYANNEQSYVESPCFDFTGLAFPYIEMAVWWNSLSNDGAALQYSLDAGTTWLSVGQLGDTVNWYTTGNISGLSFASQQAGWTGSGSAASGGWVIARHDLKTPTGTSLGGQPSVKLRVVFGSNTSSTSDGFAFDNVTIKEKVANDLVLLNLVPFSQGCGLGTSEHITLKFFNNGTQALDSGDFSLGYRIDGNADVIETYTGPVVQPYTFGTYTFTAAEDLSTASQYSLIMDLIFTSDEDIATNNKSTVIYNSVITAPYLVDFETGANTLAVFDTLTMSRSRILIESPAGFFSGYGMIMDGDSEFLGWSDFDALLNPWAPTSNPARFSRAKLCVKTPDSLATLSLSFYLKQLYHQSFLWTNFRLTVNGQPIPFTRGGVYFDPSGSEKAIRPPVTPDSTTNTWQRIEADLTPYIDTLAVSMQISFESSVRLTYNAINATTGTANLLDSIKVVSTFVQPPLPPDAAPDNILSRNMQVYPNPSHGKFLVDLSAVVEQGAYIFEVMDMTGKLITRETVRMEGQPSVTIDLADQAKGIYFLKVASDKHVATRKIVIQ